MAYSPGLNYSSEGTLDRQRASAKQRAKKWDAEHNIIDAEYVELIDQKVIIQQGQQS